jgi:hypothetical protein
MFCMRGTGHLADHGACMASACIACSSTVPKSHVLGSLLFATFHLQYVFNPYPANVENRVS